MSKNHKFKHLIIAAINNCCRVIKNHNISIANTLQLSGICHAATNKCFFIAGKIHHSIPYFADRIFSIQETAVVCVNEAEVSAFFRISKVVCINFQLYFFILTLKNT
ncbi:MAG: hypothetical protein ACOCYO_00135 [Bacteroidota bacterium]